MRNGPLHSEVYNLIVGEHIEEPLWSQYIQRDGYEVTLRRNPGLSELSAAEVRTLTRTFETYATTDEWDLVEITHGFPEWNDNYPDKSRHFTNDSIPRPDSSRWACSRGTGDSSGSARGIRCQPNACLHRPAVRDRMEAGCTFKIPHDPLSPTC